MWGHLGVYKYTNRSNHRAEYIMSHLDVDDDDVQQWLPANNHENLYANEVRISSSSDSCSTIASDSDDDSGSADYFLTECSINVMQIHELHHITWCFATVYQTINNPTVHLVSMLLDDNITRRFGGMATMYQVYKYLDYLKYTWNGMHCTVAYT